MSEELQTYLGSLQFDPRLLKGWVAGYLKNIRLMILLILTISVVGVWALITMPRSLNPEVNIPIVSVSTAFPGASPDSVESLVSIPVENAVKKVKGITNYTSSSQENFSLVVLEFTADTDPRAARDEVRAAVEQVQLPEDALDPQVQELDFEDIPVWTFALTKKGNGDTASLMRLTETVRDELETMSSVDRVILSGFDEQEIQITMSPSEISQRGVDPFALSQTVSTALLAFPGGAVQTEKNQLSLGMNPSADNLQQLRELPVQIDGQTYRLGELGTVMERSVPGQQLSYLATPDHGAQPVVQFSVYRTKNTQFDEAAKAMQAKVEELIAPYQDQYEVITIADYNQEIDTAFGDLMNNFWQTLALVAGTMFIIYGFRQATVASLAVPFPLLITFGVMVALGISLNFLSIFSLLIALGLFVDNAVVIIEGFSSYYKTGKFSPLQTAILVWKDFSVPLVSINLVTVWAFLPLLLSSGIIGEFIKSLPIIVSVSMFASVVIALLFTLPSMMILAHLQIPKRVIYLSYGAIITVILALSWSLLPQSVMQVPTFLVFVFLLFLLFVYRRNLVQLFQTWQTKVPWLQKTKMLTARVMDRGIIQLDPLTRWYQRQIMRLMATRSARLKTLGLVITFTLATYLLLPLGFITNEFFPESDMDTLYVSVELPVGTRSDRTAFEMQSLLEDLRQTPEIKLVLGEVGQGGSGNLLMGSGGGGSNTMNITLLLKPMDDRKITSMDIAQQLREKYANYQIGKLQVQEVQGGPPAGADIDMKILGEDLGTIDIYVSQIEDYLQSQEGITNINTSVKDGPSKLTFQADLDAVRTYGLSEAQIGYWIRLMGSGTPLATARFTDKEQKIMLRFSPESAQVTDLSQLTIPTNAAGSLPLLELGNLKLESNPTVISRENGQRNIAVTASVLEGYSTTQLNEQLQNFIENELHLQRGYSWKTGGVNEENAQSVQSTIQAMAVSAILILTSMVVQLKSFRKAILVMLVIPLAISGVFFWFAVTGTPLSYPALIGLLSLFGIVVANSIVLIDKINQNLEAGLPPKDAIVDAATSRLEPIALTSFASVVGLIPITLADPLWRGLGGSIIAGLSFSGVLMLFFIPVAYYYFFPEVGRKTSK